MGIMGIGGGVGSLFSVYYAPVPRGNARECSLELWRHIEGLLTCVVSFLFYFIIVDFPEEAKFLTDEERAFVKARLQGDVGESAREEKIKPKDVLAVFKDCMFRFTCSRGRGGR